MGVKGIRVLSTIIDRLEKYKVNGNNVPLEYCIHCLYILVIVSNSCCESGYMYIRITSR